MTYFMVSGMVAFAITIFLLWCLRGFTRALKEGGTVGLLVQPVPDRRVLVKHNVRRIIHTSMQAQTEWHHDFSNASPAPPVTYRPMEGVKYGRRRATTLVLCSSPIAERSRPIHGSMLKRPR
jgi:hypothetical protein